MSSAVTEHSNTKSAQQTRDAGELNSLVDELEQEVLRDK
jgi:hypothetical protein